MYPNGAEEQTTESASRRADIPGKEEEELAKKQAVAYPYHYVYPGYTMAHGINPYYHFTPMNYVRHIFFTLVPLGKLSVSRTFLIDINDLVNWYTHCKPNCGNRFLFVSLFACWFLCSFVTFLEDLQTLRALV